MDGKAKKVLKFLRKNGAAEALDISIRASLEEREVQEALQYLESEGLAIQSVSAEGVTFWQLTNGQDSGEAAGSGDPVPAERGVPLGGFVIGLILTLVAALLGSWIITGYQLEDVSQRMKRVERNLKGTLEDQAQLKAALAALQDSVTALQATAVEHLNAPVPAAPETPAPSRSSKGKKRYRR